MAEIAAFNPTAEFRKADQMKFIVAMALIAISLSACTNSSGTSATASADMRAAGLTEEEKHRLYTAALAASDSPVESEIFKEVCKKIGIFDNSGSPNDSYMPFVSAHVNWAMKTETEQFKREINSKEKAREYVSKYLP